MKIEVRKQNQLFWAFYADLPFRVPGFVFADARILQIQHALQKI
jgi:hypothetical protein